MIVYIISYIIYNIIYPIVSYHISYHIVLYYIFAYIEHNGDVSHENYSSFTIVWLSRICSTIHTLPHHLLQSCSFSTCLPSSESLHPFVNFPLANEVIALLNRHSTVNFASFYTLWAQKSGHLHRYFSFMRSINRAASVKQWQCCYHYFRKMRTNQMPMRERSQYVFQQLHYN
jgi:hypothetical protein